MGQCKYCNMDASRSKRAAVQSIYGRGDGQALIRKHRPPENTPCQVCARPMSYKRSARLMCFDHDPVTHEHRGWLCQNCNTAIGKLGDSVAGVLRALNYLNNCTKPNE